MKTEVWKTNELFSERLGKSLQAPVSHKFIVYEEKDVARLLYFIQFNMLIRDVLCRLDELINLRIWQLIEN